MSPPVLKFTDYKREFVAHIDASEIGVGAFLAQPSKHDESTSDLDYIAFLDNGSNTETAITLRR